MAGCGGGGGGGACVVVLVSPELVTLTPIIALQTGNLVAGRQGGPITEIIGVGTHDHISQGVLHQQRKHYNSHARVI